MTPELKQLIEDAARLLGLSNYRDTKGWREEFNPLDPERGDLMKVAMAAGLILNPPAQFVESPETRDRFYFTKGDYDSKVLAILRAASAVLKARGE